MRRIKYPMSHEWHVVCNVANDGFPKDSPRYMYEAMTMADEVPRMVMLFKQEREKALPQQHQQCSLQSPEPIKENHLTCCKGVKCAECPALLALEKMQRVTPYDIDEAKAWTCAAHIVSTSSDTMRTSYLITVGNHIY